VRFTDTEGYFVSEASVYRLLKALDLIASSAYIVMKAADEFADKTMAIGMGICRKMIASTMVNFHNSGGCEGRCFACTPPTRSIRPQHVLIDRKDATQWNCYVAISVSIRSRI
jgi:hypothetical protein